jgi:hypothetical protein
MILNKTPPQKKTQHEMNASVGSSPARALAGGQILMCMPAGDSKNEPHREKKAFFLLSVWAHNHKETRHQTSAASGAKTQSHNAMQRRSRFWF